MLKKINKWIEKRVKENPFDPDHFSPQDLKAVFPWQPLFLVRFLCWGCYKIGKYDRNKDGSYSYQNDMGL